MMRLAIISLLLTLGPSLAADAEPLAPAAQTAGRAEFLITTFGATPDDETLDTAAIQNAIDACAAPGGGTTTVNFMHEYQGPWAAADLYRAKRAYFAAVMLHDALPTGNHNGHAQKLIEALRQFGLGADDVTFLPYWDEIGLSTKGDDIKLAGWQRLGKLLLLVANFGKAQTAQVKLELGKLGWRGATLAVSDPEQGQTLTVHGHGGPATITHDAPAPRLNGTTLTVPVERHKYRLLIIEKK